jgi:hypothetical protein
MAQTRRQLIMLGVWPENLPRDEDIGRPPAATIQEDLDGRCDSSRRLASPR